MRKSGDARVRARRGLTRLRAWLLAATALAPVVAHATLSVTPLTWNVIGLDSNSPAAGPQNFPVGARVCSTSATSNVSVQLVWDSPNAFVNARPGSQTTLSIPSLAANGCSDAYFEVQVTRDVAAFDTTRRYHITASDGSGTASTPVPRELYVEHLISQNRNSITGIKVDGATIPAGGSVGMVVGNTYVVELDSGTATQGYNQFEAFINLSNAVFQILSVQTTYSADNSPYVPGPAPAINDKLYADACKWENNPASPNYRACVGGDFKAGGSNVVTIYTIKIIGGGGTSQALSTLLYDFSGSSFHYNADFGVHGIVANIVDPAALAFAKQFSPSSTAPGGTSTLTFTIANPNAAPITDVGFTDPLPSQGGGQMAVASPATYSATGCGAPTFAPTAGATTLSVGNATIPANGTCTISVQVAVPVAPTSGTYVNTSGDLIVGAFDTGTAATASLGLSAIIPPTNICGLTLAQWTMEPAAGTTVPPAFSSKAANVASAVASAGAGITSQIDATVGNPVDSWSASGFATTTTLSTANNDYFQFAVDTTNYTNITFTFDARLDTNAHGPGSLQLYSSTDGTTFTPYGSALSPTASFASFGPAVSGANASGVTYFRIYGYNAFNSGASSLLYLDNVKVGGCSTPQPPTLAKAFAPSTVVVGGTSTLTFTLTNPNGAALTGASFTDALPAGMQVAPAPSATNTCGGTWSPAGGAASLALSGGTLPANGSCTLGVDVVATTAGTHANVSGFLATTESGTNSTSTGSAAATLQALVPPSIAAAFAPASVQVNANAVLTFTLTNPNAAVALAAVSFSNILPAGLANANPAVPAVVDTCGGTLTASPGGTSIALAGGAIPAAGTCTIAVPVASAAAGTYVTTTGTIADAVAGTGNTASATLDVTAPRPASSVLKQVGTSASGPWLAFVAAAPGTPLYYRFTVENTGDVPLNPFGVADPTLASAGIDPATCAWQTSNLPSTLPTLPVATATVDPTATCVVGPVAASLGAHSNTATAQGTYAGNAYASTGSTADYVGALPGFSLVKEVASSPLGPWSPAIGAAAGSDVFYRFTLVNTGGLDLSGINVTDAMVDLSSCTFTDPLVVGDATTCTVGPVVATGSTGSVVVNTATGHGTNGGTVDTAPSSASYTIASANADLAITIDDGVTSVVAGGSTTYTVVVSNNGPDDVANASVTDTAPAGMTFGAWTCAVTNAGSGGVVTACGTPGGSGNVSTTATLSAGGSVTYTIDASVDVAASGSLTTTASVAAPAGVFDALAGNDSASDTDNATSLADVAITVTDGVTSVNAGASVVYTITATNAGPSAVSAASVTDAFPASIGGITWTCAAVGGNCPASSGSGDIAASVDLDVGGQVVFTATGTLSAAATGTLTDTAAIALTTGTDPNPADNSATDTDTITAATVATDLAISVDDGVSSVAAGATTSYTVIVTNNGPSPVTGAILADAAATGLAKTGVTCAPVPGRCVTPPTIAELEGGTSALPALAVGETYAIVVTANVTASAGSVTNGAAVAAPSGVTDTQPANDAASDTDTVTAAAPSADLAISAGASPGTVLPGGNITYTLTIVDSGPAGAANAAVTDTAPAGVAFGAWICSVTNAGSGGLTTACGAASGSGNVATTVTLNPGAIVTYVIAATVSPGASGNIVDAARVDVPAGMTDPTPANNAATATVGVQAAPSGVAQPIPTLGEWALAALSLLMLGVAAHALRRGPRRG